MIKDIKPNGGPGMTGKKHPMKPDRAKIKPNMIITVVNCRFVVTIQVVRFKVHSSRLVALRFSP